LVIYLFVADARKTVERKCKTKLCNYCGTCDGYTEHKHIINSWSPLTLSRRMRDAPVATRALLYISLYSPTHW